MPTATLTDYDVYLWAEGTHARSYEKLGAHLTERDGVAGGLDDQSHALTRVLLVGQVDIRCRRLVDKQVVSSLGNADDFTERPAVVPICLPVRTHKPRAPANALSRLEKRNIAAQNTFHEGRHLGLEEHGGGPDVCR